MSCVDICHGNLVVLLVSFNSSRITSNYQNSKYLTIKIHVLTCVDVKLEYYQFKFVFNLTGIHNYYSSSCSAIEVHIVEFFRAI